jgi:hypothetical protein
MAAWPQESSRPPRPALFRCHHPTTTSATLSPRSPASMERPAAHLYSPPQAAALRDRPPVVLFSATRGTGKEFPFPATALSSVTVARGRSSPSPQWPSPRSSTSTGGSGRLASRLGHLSVGPCSTSSASCCCPCCAGTARSGVQGTAPASRGVGW